MVHLSLEEIMDFRLSSATDVDVFVRLIKITFDPKIYSEISKQRAIAEAKWLSELQQSLSKDQLL